MSVLFTLNLTFAWFLVSQIYLHKKYRFYLLISEFITSEFLNPAKNFPICCNRKKNLWVTMAFQTVMVQQKSSTKLNKLSSVLCNDIRDVYQKCDFQNKIHIIKIDEFVKKSIITMKLQWSVDFFSFNFDPQILRHEFNIKMCFFYKNCQLLLIMIFNIF